MEMKFNCRSALQHHNSVIEWQSGAITNTNHSNCKDGDMMNIARIVVRRSAPTSRCYSTSKHTADKNKPLSAAEREAEMKRLRGELMRADRLGPSWAPSLLPWIKKTKRGHKFDEDDWRNQFDTSGSHLGDSRIQWRYQESSEHGEREVCYINNTRVPEHLEHWITNPNGVKRARDRKLVKQLHRKQHEAKKHARHQSNRMIRLLHEDASTEATSGTSEGPSEASVLDITQQESSYAHVMTQLHNTSIRQQRVARVVFDAVNKHMQRTYLDKHATLRKAAFHVKWVHVTRDLLKANLYWGCTAGHEEQVKAELKSVVTPLRSDVTHTIKLKYSPELIFIRDTNSQKQVQVYKLLEEVESRIDKQK